MKKFIALSFNFIDEKNILGLQHFCNGHPKGKHCNKLLKKA